MIYHFPFVFIAICTFLPNLSIAQNQTHHQEMSVCDSLISQAASLRLQKKFNKAELLLESIISSCDNKLPIYTELAIVFIEKADNTYNENGKIDKKERLSNFNHGLFYARKAYAIDSTNKYALEYLALAFAGIISQGSLSQQANLADSVRIYAEKMIYYDPTNDRAYHILGRWHYEVANLGWVIKVFSNLIFGVNPDGSFGKSIYYFQHAVDLDDYPVHNYWLALSYLKNGDSKKAKLLFKHVIDLPKMQHNDDYFKEKAREMLKDLD